MTTPLEVRPLDGAGAEILGVDITQMTIGEWDQVQAAFAAFGVVFFRDQIVTEPEHIEFAGRWGQVNVNRFFAAHELFPEIALVVKNPDDTNNIGSRWQADHSYDCEPALGSVLVARELPTSGGDTLFCSMYAAYEALSSTTQRELEGLTALHSAHSVADGLEPVKQPVVIRHPISGRKVLFVNPTFTVGIDGVGDIEALALLNQLYEHCQRDEFIGRFCWEPGSVALWDNRAVWHIALNDYPGQRRIMHQITIDGCELTPASTGPRLEPSLVQRAGATLAGGVITAAMTGIAEVIDPEKARHKIEIVSDAPEQEPLTPLDFGGLPPLD
jgi:taurine dioxygenase